MAQLKNFYQTLAGFGSRVQVTLHESLNVNGYKRVGFFLEPLCLRNYYSLLFYERALLWSLGLFLNPQGSHSNRLCVWLGSMATKGCDLIRGKLNMPRKIKIRVWKMSDQMNVFLDHVLWNGKLSWVGISLHYKFESHWVISLGYRCQWSFPKDLFAALLLFIHSSFFIAP